jgi:hypothetical protein
MAGPSGARPRLVCRTTPVALMTRRSEGAVSACAARADLRFDDSLANAVGRARADLAARVVQRPADLCDDQMPRYSRRGYAFGDLVYGRQVAQFFAIGHLIRHLFDGTEGCATCPGGRDRLH